MPTLDDVYRKFGEASEATQIIETTLNTMLLKSRLMDEGLLENNDPTRAMDILESVNRQTLGRLLKNLKNHTQSLDVLEGLLSRALQERNRLFHSFYREHDFRRNSDEGRAVMMEDLESIHSVLLEAIKALLVLGGVDVDAEAEMKLPTPHLPI